MLVSAAARLCPAGASPRTWAAAAGPSASAGDTRCCGAGVRWEAAAPGTLGACWSFGVEDKRRFHLSLQCLRWHSLSFDGETFCFVVRAIITVPDTELARKYLWPFCPNLLECIRCGIFTTPPRALRKDMILE